MKNSEESAFAFTAKQDFEQGLTKREYFAGIALGSIISNAKTMEELTKEFNKNKSDKKYEFSELIARLSLYYADGLLESLEK